MNKFVLVGKVQLFKFRNVLVSSRIFQSFLAEMYSFFYLFFLSIKVPKTPSYDGDSSKHSQVALKNSCFIILELLGSILNNFRLLLCNFFLTVFCSGVLILFQTGSRTTFTTSVGLFNKRFRKQNKNRTWFRDPGQLRMFNFKEFLISLFSSFCCSEALNTDTPIIITEQQQLCAVIFDCVY